MDSTEGPATDDDKAGRVVGRATNLAQRRDEEASELVAMRAPDWSFRAGGEKYEKSLEKYEKSLKKYLIFRAPFPSIPRRITP